MGYRELKSLSRKIGAAFMPYELFAPATLGPATLRNRIVKAATFEGLSVGNVVTRSLIDFHRRFAAGGVALTTVSYLAVSADGQGAPNEIIIHERAADGLARVAEAVHVEGGSIAAQLGHAGAVGAVPGKRAVGPSKARTLTGAVVKPITVGEIDQVVADFGQGVAMLADAGFDSVELHFGHHYLISSFLSPKWNKRTDDYGGSVENRARLARRVLSAASEASAGRVAITAKLNMTDGIRGGLSVADSVATAKLLESDGLLDAIELTGGGSQRNQMFMFRGDAPREQMAQLLQNRWQKLGFKLFGRQLLKDYPFEEAYFLPMAREFRSALSLPLILLGGINTIGTMRQAMAEGFEFVALGRALLRDPDLVNKLRDGEATQGTCVHCNKCMLSIYTGTRCVLDNPKPIKIQA